MLPVNHADFFQIDSGTGAGLLVNPPTFVDTGVDLTHKYVYYACQQAGVPALDSYWQPIEIGSGTQIFVYDPTTKLHVASVTAFQTTDKLGQPAIQLVWVGDSSSNGGYIVSWNHSIGGTGSYQQILATGSDESQQIQDAFAPNVQECTFTAPSPLIPGDTYTFSVEAVAGQATRGNSSKLLGPTDPVFSNSVTIDSAVAVPTMNPIGVTAAPAGTGAIQINWNLPGGADLISFTLKRPPIGWSVQVPGRRACNRFGVRLYGWNERHHVHISPTRCNP